MPEHRPGFPAIAAPPADRPLRVRLCTDTLADVNGVSRFIHDMLRLAAAAGHDLAAITSTRHPLPAHTPAADRILNLPPLWARPMPGYPALDLAFPARGAVGAALMAARPDVVHLSTPGPVGFAAWRAAHRLGIPIVATYHTDFPAYIDGLFDDPALTRCCAAAMRAFYSRCARVLSRSAAYARVVKDLGIHCSRITALRPGTDTHRFHPRHRDPAPSPTLRVLYVGRVSVEKNLPLLARAWRSAAARLSMLGHPAELIIVGDGPYLPAMRTALTGTPTRFLGFRTGDELSTLYASADLFVFPSATDTLGQGVLEAQASGLPALVSDIGGPPEIARHGLTGLVLSAHDPRAWAEAIVALAAETPRRAAMAAAARTHAETLTIERSFAHFWSLHEQVAGWQGGALSPTIRPPCLPPLKSPSTAACTPSRPAR